MSDSLNVPKMLQFLPDLQTNLQATVRKLGGPYFEPLLGVDGEGLPASATAAEAKSRDDALDAMRYSEKPYPTTLVREFTDLTKVCADALEGLMVLRAQVDASDLRDKDIFMYRDTIKRIDAHHVDIITWLRDPQTFSYNYVSIVLALQKAGLIPWQR